MLSFHGKFVQADRQTDNGKTICPQYFHTGAQNAIVQYCQV